MANRRVTIWRYAKTDGTWKYHKPTYGRNNKIKPEDGTYYIRWRNGTKMEWQRCHNAANAEEACRRREAMLTAQEYGIVPPGCAMRVPERDCLLHILWNRTWSEQSDSEADSSRLTFPNLSS
jgi:hypothetical protein